MSYSVKIGTTNNKGRLIAFIFNIIFAPTTTNFIINYFTKFLFPPPFGQSIYDFGGFVAGVAEVDEPLFVEALGGFFEEFYLLLVVFYQIVVGGKDIGNFLLCFIIRSRELYRR